MKITKVINIEDNIYKAVAIDRALRNCGITDIDLASTGDTGIKKIETAIQDGQPYDLLITDMHYNIHGRDNENAGEIVIEELQQRGIIIPIVVCSSHPYNIPGTIECIFYNERSRVLEGDVRRALEKLNDYVLARQKGENHG